MRLHILFNFTYMRPLVLLLLMLTGVNFYAAGKEEVSITMDHVELRLQTAAIIEDSKPSPVWVRFFKKQNQRKKMIASALAFPLPCGFLGLHRVYLGTKPYVPVVYVGTLGGVGILALIDFCNLVSNKDISRFQANPHIFMWVDNEKKQQNP